MQMTRQAQIAKAEAAGFYIRRKRNTFMVIDSANQCVLATDTERKAQNEMAFQGKCIA
jgi:hypothetical protein